MDALVCSRCGYSLTGLPENRCPECGLSFDRAAMEQEARLRAAGVISGRRAMIREMHPVEIVVVQLVVGLLYSVITAEAPLETWFTSVVAYWAAFLVYILRKRSFTRNQIAVVRWSWIPLLVVTGILAAMYVRVFAR